MTRNTNGVWSFRREGLELSAPSLDSLISAFTELGIKPRAEKKIQELTAEMERLVGGSDEWVIAKTKRDVWKEILN